jgi:tetratricopeptide (TPR) repeat protein
MSSRRTLPRLLLVLLVLLSAARAHAGYEGRIVGTVVDENNAPIAGVTVTVTSPDFKYNKQYTSAADGKFTITVIDASRKYAVKLEKEGFAPFEAALPLEIGATKRMTYQLPHLQQAAAPAEPSAEELAKRQALEGKNEAIRTYNDGVVALQAKDLDTAAAKFTAAAALEPTLEEAWAALGAVLLDQKKWAEASAALEKAYALNPKDARVISGRYDAYRGLGDNAKATAALEVMRGTAPPRDIAVRQFNEAAELSRNGKGDEAIAALRAALVTDPGLAPAHSALASIYISRKAYKDALASADSLLALDPGNLEGLTVRYEALKGMGDKAKMKEAEAALKAAKTDQGPAALFNQGVTQFNANAIQDARATFEKVIELDAKHVRAHYMLGLVYANLGDAAKAKQYLQKFVELAPAGDPDLASAKAMLETM